VAVKRPLRRCKRLVKKFPYGLSDFYKIITEGYFYVDRTEYIRPVEESGSQLLFLRPRRFGKRRDTPLLDVLIEFKYVSLKEVGMSGSEVRQSSREELRSLP